MLEIWMDQGNNDAKVRIVVQISHIHNLKQWLTTFSNATLIAHTSYISIFVTKRITCWRFEWIMIMIIRIVIADKSNQQFETKSYHHPQCNSGRSHFLLYHLAQDTGKLEIWIDHDNETKVRIAEDKSNQHLKQWLTLYSYATLTTHTSYISSIIPKILAC